MQSVELLMRILITLLDISCVSPMYGENVLKDFESQHCFHPVIQAQLTADVLQLLCENTKPYRVYVVQAALDMKLLLFLFESHPIILGPFVEKEWNEREAKELLMEHNLPEKYLLLYKSYYCNYHCLHVEDAVYTVTKIIAALNPEAPQYKKQVLFALKGSDAVLPIHEEPTDFDMTIERYKRENLVLRMVRQGNTEEALKAMQNMSIRADGLRYPVQKENRVASLNIIRTLLRKAAEEGGVHPVVVDAISQEYAQKTYAARSMEELTGISKEMVQDYCAAVRKAQKNSYIPPVRKAITYIELNLSSIENLEPLAKVAGVSTGYLSHAFKSEVGCTIMQYIATKRCEKAADLLENSRCSIQDISNYVGYSDNNYFVKVFKARYHMTPSQYRRQSHSLITASDEN